MSLINQVLQELDARGANDAVVSAQTAHIKLAPARAEWRAKPLLAFVLLAILLALALWALRAFTAAKPDWSATGNSAASSAPRAGTQPTANTDHVQSRQPSSALPNLPVAPIAPNDAGPAMSALFNGLKMAETLDRLPKDVASVPTAPNVNAVPTPATSLSAKMLPSPPDEGKLASNATSNPANNPTSKPTSRPDAPASLEIQAQNNNPQQRAENEYRRANQFLQQAKTQDALQALEQALLHDKHHLAARQTLVTLLLSSNRNEEALRQLQQGLQLDPGHTVFAMMLARVQAERNDLPAAIETMYGHLPIAVSNAEYQASLAALLQRDKRHREAIEHFLVALQLRPENGVWWMGLGISLQAENRFAQAKDAFTRASQSRSLNTQLNAFVEQKLNQLEAKLQNLAQDVQ